MDGGHLIFRWEEAKRTYMYLKFINKIIIRHIEIDTHK